MGIHCCKDCAERYREIKEDGKVYDCHDHCETYITLRKELDEFNKANRERLKLNGYSRNYR